MKKILKAIDVAFSMYSKIPMPRFQWDSGDMEYHLCFFPWIGACIGILEYVWFLFSNSFISNQFVVIPIAMAIPLLVTGGFHVDGFMDTMDALHSYQSREKKLEILKDPHIGAFSVISLLCYVLLVLGFLEATKGEATVKVLCCGFFLARTLSGISVVSFPKAKNEGMLKTSSRNAAQRSVLIVLIIQGIICCGVMMFLQLQMGIIAIVAMILTFMYYYVMSKKQFGGTTGDLAGYYVVMAEGISVMAVGLACILQRM